MIKQLFSNKRWLCAILVTLTISVPNVWGVSSTSITSYSDGTYYVVDVYDSKYYAMTGAVSNNKISSTEITDYVTLNQNGTITINISSMTTALTSSVTTTMQYTFSHQNTVYTIACGNSAVQQKTSANDLVSSSGNNWGLATDNEYAGRFSFTSSFVKNKKTTNSCLLFQGYNKPNATEIFKGYAQSNRGVVNDNAQSYGSGYMWLVPASSASSCGTPTSVGTKNGSISSTGFTATWTAPSSAPANGYYVAYSTSSSAPGDITASSGDYTVVSVGAGTTEKAISGLTDGGLYYFWVRSRCSASDNSGWSDRASVQLSKINLSQTSLTGMTYVYNGASGGPSSQTKSFTVTGTNVGGNLTVSAPTNFQVSTDNSSWGSSKTITATSGSASGTVYVRLAGGLNAGSYGSASTYVTVSDGGSKASSKTVSVTGSVTKASLNPSFGSATYNITRDVSTSTSFTLTNVPSDYTGTITYERSSSPTASARLVVDGTNMTFTANYSGSWTVTAKFAADANYNAKASGVTCTVNAVTRDTYVDNVNGQSVSEAQRTDDGVNPYTSPALSDVAAGSACKGTKTHLIGWATATFIANVGNGTLTGADSDYTQANGFYAVGETLPAASGVTYYAVYGEEE